VAEELLDFLEFRLGEIQVFLRVLRILLLHEVMGFGQISLQALLGRDDIAAKPVALRGLLPLQVVQGLRYSGGAAIELIVLVLGFFGESGVNGWSRRGAHGRGLLGRISGGALSVTCAAGRGIAPRGMTSGGARHIR
jgi:hypothetical protein